MVTAEIASAFTPLGDDIRSSLKCCFLWEFADHRYSVSTEVRAIARKEAAAESKTLEKGEPHEITRSCCLSLHAQPSLRHAVRHGLHMHLGLIEMLKIDGEEATSATPGAAFRGGDSGGFEIGLARQGESERILTVAWVQ